MEASDSDADELELETNFVTMFYPQVCVLR